MLRRGPAVNDIVGPAGTFRRFRSECCRCPQPRLRIFL